MAALHYTLLFQHFNRYTALSVEEFEICKRYFKEEEFRLHDLVVKAGQTIYTQYFVAQGCLRTFFKDEQRDRDFTVQFAVEEWWASDFMAYYNNQPATLQVECLEPSILLSIEKKQLALLQKEVPALETFFLRKLENAFVAFQKRILSNMKDTAEERYEEFLRQYPNIEPRVKNFQIASYLGITPESLSRIRKARAQSQN